MSQSVAAKRYALALFELAQQNGQIAPIQEELQELKKVFQDNKGLGQLLEFSEVIIGKKEGTACRLIQRSESARFEYIVRPA